MTRRKLGRRVWHWLRRNLLALNNDTACVRRCRQKATEEGWDDEWMRMKIKSCCHSLPTFKETCPRELKETARSSSYKIPAPFLRITSSQGFAVWQQNNDEFKSGLINAINKPASGVIKLPHSWCMISPQQYTRLNIASSCFPPLVEQVTWLDETRSKGWWRQWEVIQSRLMTPTVQKQHWLTLGSRGRIYVQQDYSKRTRWQTTLLIVMSFHPL